MYYREEKVIDCLTHNRPGQTVYVRDLNYLLIYSALYNLYIHQEKKRLDKIYYGYIR